jgi:hypothetical protein
MKKGFSAQVEESVQTAFKAKCRTNKLEIGLTVEHLLGEFNAKLASEPEAVEEEVKV